MPDWVVVADDLTGALDAAAALAPNGGGRVLLGPDVPWPDASRLVAVSTRSRDGDTGETPVRVRAAAARALDRQARVFLKIDSLVRGEVGPAVRAALEVHRARRGACLAVVAPAFPARGRVTRAGRVEVAGDERPVQPDVVAALAAAGLRSVVIARDAPLPTPEALHREAGGALDAVVVDCESDDDLARVAADLVARPELLPVGTAGLAGRLSSSAGPADASGAVLGGRAVAAIGSFAPTAVAQVTAAVRAGIPQVPVSADPAAAGREARERLRGGHVVLTPGSTAGDPDTVAGMLADAVAEAADLADLLVLSGGHTAQAVLDRLGATRLDLVAELEPGVVASRSPGLRQLVVTKAGAFGDDATLLRLLPPLTSSLPGRSTS